MMYLCGLKGLLEAKRPAIQIQVDLSDHHVLRVFREMAVESWVRRTHCWYGSRGRNRAEASFN